MYCIICNEIVFFFNRDYCSKSKEIYFKHSNLFYNIVILAHYSYITYIIGRYNPSVRIIDLVSHTTYVVCVNFIHKWRDQQFNVDSERQIFLRNFSWQFYLLTEFLPEIC